MITFVPAKINIGLYVVSRREDGYHNLETVFYPIGLHNGTPSCPYPFGDILEITPCDETVFEFTGRVIDCPLEKNLVVKAYRLFEKEYALKTGRILGSYRVQLYKNIPDGAGIGGGSADATYTLTTLNSLNNNIFAIEELKRLAVMLGADCPCFLYPAPMYGQGIGENLTQLNLDLTGKWLILVKPDLYVSTKEAFANVYPQVPNNNLKETLRLPIQDWRNKVYNDFEISISKSHPIIMRIKESLYDEGADFASMSGSGSSVYGIFDNKELAVGAYESLNARYSDCYCALIML
ncbi:MAG: 4-(cytidine 5'-diphospho)-2-C-methyl-D-erythritol kinase [Prevotella sp.]|nr:4-(cytidine 5'-diphospho)-2-C-methyl-D-erythritol kinase [Bacteroides sp.]MCM1366289.1 4-(cytidine 5'-diphospho)-2-C-methyl-D-erythritol kinase [Prevotella sp.]MCM1437093.1 4-(cytidine 5'-diphospho)-2-C-methyl-D-erythritol kinase [Prevotella sp.]